MNNDMTRHLLRSVTMPFTLASTLFAVGCTSAPWTAPPPPTTTAEFLATMAPEPIKVELDTKQGGVIRGRGTSFTIPPGAVFQRDGSPADLDTDGDGRPDSRRVNGIVTVELRELLSPESMMAAGRPTVTSAGELLETGGAFDLKVRERGQEVQVMNLLDLRITPDRSPSSGDDMELWLYDARSDRFGWDPPPGGSVAAKPVDGSFTIPIVPTFFINLGGCNVDEFPPPTPPNPVAPTGPVHVQLAAGAPGASAVFFFPEGLSSVIRLDRDVTRSGGAPTFVGPSSAMPGGLHGKLVVVSAADGRYFFAQRMVALDSPDVAPDDGGRTFVVSPTEVTEDALRAQLRSL
jgi:hypothetical protein